MKAIDSFDVAPPRVPGRVKRLDLYLKVTEVDIPEVPAVEAVEEVLAVDAVLDPETGEVITPAVEYVAPVEAVPAVPAHSELRYEDSFQFHRPDSAGGEDYHSGALRPHLTTAQKTGIKNLLDGLFAKANGE